MKIQFNDHEQIYTITLFRKNANFIILKGDGIPAENTSGFKVLDSDRVKADYSSYTTKYNVITPAEGMLLLSTGIVETEDSPAGAYIYTPKPEEIKEDVDPLTNEELTECVADLMYESSLRQLGL